MISLVLIGTTFTGQIVYASSFQRSTAYVSHIFEDTHHKHPQFDWEMNIGDGHFGTCPNFFTPIRKKHGGRLLTAQITTWNECIQLPRARIEHINAVVKNHRMFKVNLFVVGFGISEFL